MSLNFWSPLCLFFCFVFFYLFLTLKLSTDRKLKKKGTLYFIVNCFNSSNQQQYLLSKWNSELRVFRTHSSVFSLPYFQFKYRISYHKDSIFSTRNQEQVIKRREKNDVNESLMGIINSSRNDDDIIKMSTRKYTKRKKGKVNMKLEGWNEWKGKNDHFNYPKIVIFSIKFTLTSFTSLDNDEKLMCYREFKWETRHWR